MRSLALSLPFAIRPLRNVLVSTFHTHLTFTTDCLTRSQHEACSKFTRAALLKA